MEYNFHTPISEMAGRYGDKGEAAKTVFAYCDSIGLVAHALHFGCLSSGPMAVWVILENTEYQEFEIACMGGELHEKPTFTGEARGDIESAKNEAEKHIKESRGEWFVR